MVNRVRSMTTVPTDILARGVALACRAPSYHNSQPWHWVADRDRLHLYLDPNRVVQTDFTQRQALISCGAVLDHLRVAMAAAGWETMIDRLPDPNHLEHLASIDFTETTVVTDGHRRRRSGPYFDGGFASETSMPALSEGVKPNRVPMRSITSAASFAIRQSGFTT